MKKRLLAALLAIAIMTCICFAVAAGTAGSSSDPLISLSYLTSTFKPGLLSETDSRVNSALGSVYDSAVASIPAGGGSTSYYTSADVPTELDLKYGDSIFGITGTSVTPLAGTVRLSYSGSAVIDVTDGKTVSSGTTLTADHRYIVGEDTDASFIVAQDTSVVSVMGEYIPSYGYATDYYALADALYKLGLFKGDGTSFGKGYALERTATRLEGLIMFIRLLGEDSAAQAYTGSHPFSDVPNWAKSYVAYAYSKGYTKGVGGGKFGTNDTLTAQHYVTFIMRALGYTEGADFTWTTAMSDAVALSVITSGEKNSVSTGTFYRSKVAYLSYFTLFARLSASETTLLEKLENAGSVDSFTAANVIAYVAVSRIQ